MRTLTSPSSRALSAFQGPRAAKANRLARKGRPGEIDAHTREDIGMMHQLGPSKPAHAFSVWSTRKTW